QLTSIYVALQEEYPETNTGWSVRLVPLSEWNAKIGSDLILLLTAVGFVLLIACANIANLLMSRTMSRARELAIRQAVGASRWRLARQLLSESLMLAIAGGAAGLLVALFCLDFLNRALPQTAVRRVGDFHLDSRVLLFSLTISIMAGLAFGLLPAIFSPRPRLVVALKEGGSQRSTSAGARLAGELLIICEVALTVALLASASLVIRGALHLHLLDRGLDTRNILIMQLWLPKARYPEGWQVAGFYNEALQRI